MGKAGLPIAIYLKNVHLFLVKNPVGKAFSSGGYGVNCGGQEVYLYIEEALFLLERKLILVFEEKGGEDTKKGEEAPKGGEERGSQMTTQDLFDILPLAGFPVMSYIVYSYLRSQSFVVLRHFNLIRNNGAGVDSSNCPLLRNLNEKNRKNNKKRKLTRDVPLIMVSAGSDPVCMGGGQGGGNSNHEGELQTTQLSWEDRMIAFDVYYPTKSFRKSDPGSPSFFLAICPFALPSPHFNTLSTLAKITAPVPLKVACVSDGATVLVFQLSCQPAIPNLNNCDNYSDDDDDDDNDK